MLRATAGFVALAAVVDLAGGQAPRNLLPSASFRPERHNWIVAGQGTTAVVDATIRHSTGNALKVADRGPQMGQATTPRIAVQAGEVYYAEAWARLDPGLGDQGLVDIEFFDAARFLGAVELGEISGAEWKHVSGYFPVLEGATSMVLRFMPATTVNTAFGAGWIDDVVIAHASDAEMAAAVPAQPVLPEDADGLRGQPPRDLQPTWFAHAPAVDFEEMAGWTCTVFPPARGQMMRSRGMPLAGKWTGRLWFASPDGSGWARLKPPHPIPIRDSFDHAQVWVYGQRRGRGVSLVGVVRDAAGKVWRIGFPAVVWPYWSITDARIREAIPAPAALESVEIWSLRTPSAEPESIYLDNLAFYREHTQPVSLSLPPPRGPLTVRLPVREESILPTPPPGTTGRVERNGATWQFLASGAGEAVEYRYEPRTGTLADLSVSLAGRRFAPCAGGGLRLRLGDREYDVGAADLRVRLLGIGGSASSPEFRFHLTDGHETTEVSYRLALAGRSLVIDARCDRGIGMVAGRPPESAGFHALIVPYLSYGYAGSPVTAHPDGLFGSWLWDYYNSDASQLSNTDTAYLPCTNGHRNPLRDRLIVTFSRKLEDVLPNIPNPPATQAPKALGEVYCAVSDWTHPLAMLSLWRQLKRHGVDHLICKQHAEIWSPDCGTGMVPFFQNPHASPAISGGDEALAAYIRAVKALGYRYALYTDYVLTTPVHERWSEDDVARESDDAWRRNWYQAFQLTPLRSWERAAHYAPLIAGLGNNASYCDQHTSGPPWNRTDYDARKPLAGMFRPVIDAYAAVFQAERRAYGGPVFSEGNCHWMMAGLCDGNYAQFHVEDRPACRVPLLVDFDLRKIHPLEMDLGMGWQEAYGLPGGFDPTGAANDRLLAATIAFGHAGLLYAPWNAPGRIDPANPMGDRKEIMLRTYFMTQQAQVRYLMRPVARIEYHDGERFVDTSEAVTSGALERSRVHVVYANGLEVWANGDFTESWEVEAGGERLVLPPAGYAVYQAKQIREHSSLMNGRRVDFAATPEYVYADARGSEADFGPVRLSGAAVIKPAGRERIRVIAITPAQTVRLAPGDLPFPAPKGPVLRVTYEDEAGARQQAETARLRNARLVVQFPPWAQQAIATSQGGQP